jgi:hypothetical protein
MSVVIAGFVACAICVGLLVSIMVVIMKRNLKARVRRLFERVAMETRDVNFGLYGLSMEDLELERQRPSAVETLKGFRETVSRVQSALSVLSDLSGCLSLPAA